MAQAADTCAVLLRPKSHGPTHHAAVTSVVLLPSDAWSSAVELPVPPPSARRRRRDTTTHEVPAGLPGDGCSVVTTSRDASIRCWTAPTAARAAATPGSARSHRSHAPDGELAMGVMRPVSLPWSAAAPAAPSADPGCFQGHSEWITSGLLLSDQRTLVTSSVDTTVKLWDLRGSRDIAAPASHCVATLTRHTDYVQSLAYSAFNELLVTGGLGFQLYSYRITPTGPRAVEDLSGGGGDTPDASAAAASAGFGLHEFDLLRGSFYSTALSTTGDTLVTGSSDEIVRLYDTRSGTTASGSASASKNWLKLLGHRDTVRAVAIDESMGTGLSRVYSADTDGSLKVWDLRTNRCLNSFHPARGHAQPVESEQYSQPPTPSFAGSGARPSHTRSAHTRHPIPLDRQVDLRERMRLQQLGSWTVTPAASTPRSAFGHSHLRAASSVQPAAVPSPSIWCMVLNAAHTIAFTGGAGPIVYATDLLTGVSSPVICFRTHPDPSQSTASSVVCLTLDEPRALLWVGTWDGNVSAWDVSHVLHANKAGTVVRPTTSSPSSTSTSVSASPSGVAFGRRRDPHLASTLSAAGAVSAPRSATPLVRLDTEREEEIYPLLLSTPQLILPLPALPPMRRCLLLHDKLHVLAHHWNNSIAPAPSTTGTAVASDTVAPATVPPLLISTWSILEGTCVDVMVIDGAVAAASPALWNLDTMAEMQNAEFARRFQAHMADVQASQGVTAAVKGKDGVVAPAVPSSKLVPNWCSVDVRFGCICVTLERRSCFAADITKWVQRDLAELPALLAAGGAMSPKSYGSSTSALGFTSLLFSRLTASARANLGEQMLFTLFSEWMLLEHTLLQAHAAQRRQTGGEIAASDAGVIVRKPAMLLRPVPPSSRVLARFLFPSTVPHAFAGSSVLLRALTALGMSSPRSTMGPSGPASPVSSSLTPSSSSFPSPLIGTSLTLLTIPPPNSPFIAEACSLPLSPALPFVSPDISPQSSRPESSTHLASVHRARNAYLRLVPSWIEGVLFAPGPAAAAHADASSLAPESERQRKTLLEQESVEDGHHYVLKSKSHMQTEQAQVLASQAQPPLLKVVRQESAPIATGAHARNASRSSLHPSHDASISSDAPPSARKPIVADPSAPLHAASLRPTSEDLINECEAAMSPKAVSAPAPTVVFVAGSGSARNSATPSTHSRRQSGALLSSRYAPQALSPSSPQQPLVAAAAAAAASAAGSSSSLQPPQSHPSITKIQLQLMPLPSSALANAPGSSGGGASRDGRDSSVRRLHFGGGGDVDDESMMSDDELPSSPIDGHGSHLGVHSRAGSSLRLPSFVSPALPNVTPGSLVVPAGLTVRRLLAYVCQRMWKAPEHASLLPREIKEEMERQRAANRANKERAANHTDGTDARASGRASKPDGSVSTPDVRNKLSLSTPSKLGPPSARGGSMMLSPAADANVLSPGGIQLSSSTSPSAAPGFVRDSPSVLRRTMSISMASVAHWERDAPSQMDGLSPPSSSPPLPPPSTTGSSPAVHLRLPADFLQLVLWDGHSSAVHVLSGDMEVGSVKEVVWPKMRRLAAHSSTDTGRRNSTSVQRGMAGGGSSLSPYGSTHSPGPIDSSDGGASSSRLMLLYYRRTPAGEAWYQSQMRSATPDAPHHLSPRPRDSRTPLLSGMATPTSSPPPLPSSRVALRTSQSRRDGSAIGASASAQPQPPPAASNAGPVSARHPPAASSSISPSASVAVVPRIVAGVQTADHLQVAVPIYLPSSLHLNVAHSVGAPIRGSLTASAHAHGTTTTLPVSSPRRSTTSISSSGVPAALTSAPRPSSAHRAASRAADPMSQANAGVILSRHRTPGK